MSLSKLEINFEDVTVEARVIVCKANVLRGLLRSKLTDEGLRTEDDDPLVHIARWTQYPALRAGTHEGYIKFYQQDPETGGRGELVREIKAATLTFDDFLALPEDLAMDWMGAIYDLNSHWLIDLGQKPDPETEEGKD